MRQTLRSLYNHLAADFWAVLSFLLAAVPVPDAAVDFVLRQYARAEDRVAAEYPE